MATSERLLNKGPAYACYLDFQKAFDTLNRGLTLLKLCDKGVTGRLWHLARLLVLPTTSAMMRFPFLVRWSLPPLGLLPMLILPWVLTVMMMFPCHVSHTVLLWFHVRVMLRFLSAPQCFSPFPLHLPSYCLPSTCPPGWRPRPMPSRVWFIRIWMLLLLLLPPL
jgi:hypothetical protein